MNFFDVQLKFILARKDDDKMRRSKHKKYVCFKPWYPDKADHSHSGKVQNMLDFHAFFHQNASMLSHTSFELKSPPPAVSTVHVSPHEQHPPKVKKLTRKVSIAELDAFKATASVIDKGNETLLDENKVISEKSVNLIKIAFEERDMDAWPLQKHELDLLELLAANENQLVAEDKVLPRTTASSIKRTLKARDFSAQPLKKHELGVLQLLVVNENTILKQATEIIEPALQNKANGSPLEEHERRLLGQLAFKAFKSEKKVSLNSFEFFSKFEIVKVPQKREAREFSPENIRRRYHNHLTV